MQRQRCQFAAYIGHKFLEVVGKCFQKKHSLHKTFNRGSYTEEISVQSIITSHNKLVLIKQSQNLNDLETGCSCRRKSTCPLKGKSQNKGIVYQATVKDAATNKEKTYKGCIGLTGGHEFKTRHTLTTPASLKIEAKKRH